MVLVVLAVRTESVAVLLAAAVCAGTGQGMAQLGGFSLLNARVPAARLAESNAALSAWGYLFAGVLPVATGYLADATSVSFAASVLGLSVAAAAGAGGLSIAVRKQ